MAGPSMYEEISLETTIHQASPHQLTALLFDGALNAIKLAILYLQKGNIAQKGASISKAINILNHGLKGSLDFDQGGNIAVNLHDLYQYIIQQLLFANLQNSEEKLQACFDLLNKIAITWRKIGPNQRGQRES